MKRAERIKKLKNADKDVFSTDELKELWGMKENWSPTVVKRFVENGILTRLAQGVYSFGDDFDPFELAGTLVSPSYISLNSALTRLDVAFQSLTTVNSVATYTYTREVKDLELKYYKIKDEIFNDDRGLREKNGYTIASPERAICDAFYLGFLPSIDNPDKLNWVRFEEVSEIYPETVQKKVKSLIEKYELRGS